MQGCEGAAILLPCCHDHAGRHGCRGQLCSKLLDVPLEVLVGFDRVAGLAIAEHAQARRILQTSAEVGVGVAQDVAAPEHLATEAALVLQHGRLGRQVGRRGGLTRQRL